MQLFCLQFEVSCLQWSFLCLQLTILAVCTYSWSFLAYNFWGLLRKPPTRTTCLKSTGGTPPICTAVRPPFQAICNAVPHWLLSFALEKGKRRNAPPICAAVRLQFVPQYASHLYRRYTLEIISGVGGSGKSLSFSFFTHNWSFVAYSGKVHLRRALRDCKQRSLTVSKKAPTVSEKSSPALLIGPLLGC